MFPVFLSSIKDIVVCFIQFRIGQVRVNLCGGDILMPGHFLGHTHVSLRGSQYLGDKEVPERVGSDLLGEILSNGTRNHA